MNLIRASILLTALVTMQGCSSLRTTPTTGLIAIEVVRDVCALWIPIGYDSRVDDPQTQADIRVNNAKNDAFCQGV